MLRKVNNSTAPHDLHFMMMIAYSQQNPVKEKGQCRFMLYVVVAPGNITPFKDLQMSGYYPGNKYTDIESMMLRNLVKMIDKEITVKKRFRIFELYDNHKNGEERIILKVTDDCINRNDLHLYSLMLTNYILPVWLKQ